MGEFIREHLPDPIGYFEGEGLKLIGPGLWRTTRCEFHGGSDSMRVNTERGSWVCMSCNVKGGDLLSYHMQRHGLEFVDAARALGAYVESGRPAQSRRKTPLSPSAALALIQSETWLIACTALATAHAIENEADRARLIEATRVIQNVMQEANE